MTCAAPPPLQEYPVTWKFRIDLEKENENHSFFTPIIILLQKAELFPTITNYLGSFKGKQYCECFGRILDNYWVTLKNLVT